MQGRLICSVLAILPSILLITNALVDASQAPTPSADAKEHVYIVYTSVEPPEGVDLDSFYTKILLPVFGSEKAAKDALLYTYQIIPGFAALLNPSQASLLKRQPRVVGVVRDKTFGPLGLDA